MSDLERIKLNNGTCDSIIKNDEKLFVPDWHYRELKKRCAAAEADPDGGIPWEVVKAELSRRK